MEATTQPTLVLLLFSLVAFNGIRYWLQVPYGSEVGSFIWITHRGWLLFYLLGLRVLLSERSCNQSPQPSQEPARHALCHIPLVC